MGAWLPLLLSTSSGRGSIGDDVFFLESLSGSLHVARASLDWMEMPKCLWKTWVGMGMRSLGEAPETVNRGPVRPPILPFRRP